MATTTSHLGLIKPEATDNASQVPFDQNFDVLDAHAASVDTKLNETLYIVSFNTSTGTLTTKSSSYTS